MSGIYPKISLLPVLSQITTIDYFVKVKGSDSLPQFSGTALLTRVKHAVIVLCRECWLTRFPRVMDLRYSQSSVRYAVEIIK